LCPGLFFSSIIIFTQSVGHFVRVISQSQGSYLHTGQHKHRINAHIDIRAFSGIRTHDPSVRASEDSSCLRPRGHRDRHFQYTPMGNSNILTHYFLSVRLFVEAVTDMTATNSVNDAAVVCVSTRISANSCKGFGVSRHPARVPWNIHWSMPSSISTRQIRQNNFIKRHIFEW
jgi:hypothetical protein